MDHSLRVEEFQCATYEEYCEEETDSILLGVGLGVEENSLDDKIRIAVENGKGVITGSNPRSVLFSVYRFLYELGCRFPSPEECNEVIPKKAFTKTDFNVDCTDAPADGDHNCDICGKKLNDCVDADKDHACDNDSACDVYFGEHADGDDNDHVCDYCQGDVGETCYDNNKDHKCDECGETTSTCVDEAPKDHACDYGCSDCHYHCR